MTPKLVENSRNWLQDMGEILLGRAVSVSIFFQAGPKSLQGRLFLAQPEGLKHRYHCDIAFSLTETVIAFFFHKLHYSTVSTKLKFPSFLAQAKNRPQNGGPQISDNSYNMCLTQKI